MEELNNLENINFSGSPEYIDVFNNGISTLSEEYGTSPTTGADCDNNTNGTYEITCSVSSGNTTITDDGTCVAALEGCVAALEGCVAALEGCALGEACVVGMEDPTPPPSTTYQVRFTFGIKVKSHLLNGENGYIGNAKINGWGYNLTLKYTNKSNDFFTSGDTYVFSYNSAISGPCYTYVKSKTNISTSSSLKSFISSITASSHTFIVVGIDGHDIPNNKTITASIKYKSGTTSSNIDIPQFTSTDTVNTLSLSAKTYNISYDINSYPSSSDYEKIVKTSIKIGTKFSVYSDSYKTKTATTGNNSAYAYSVGYRTSANTYSFRPWHRFFINTSAETIYVKQERCGESYETTVNLNYSGLVPILPPMQTSGKLATLKTLYDSSTGLGITSFQKMFSDEISSKNNMVLTPKQYQGLGIQDDTYNGTVYGYTKPTMYYSASTNSQNYCLKINDISTFDSYIYLATSTGYTNPNGMTISVEGLFVHDNFKTYKNYPLTNVKNGSDWSTSGDEKKYFTFYL